MKTFKQFNEDVPANAANAGALGFDPNTPSQTPVPAGVTTVKKKRRLPIISSNSPIVTDLLRRKSPL